MANTRDILGDQETLDALVSHSSTLTSFEEDGVTTLHTYALANQTNLERVKFPNLTSIPNYTFQNSGITKVENTDFPKITSVGQYAFVACTNLEEVDLPDTVTTINQNAFNGDGKLAHLILRRSSMVTLNNTNALTGTKIANKFGTVYVPTDELITTYMANNNWKNYIFKKISDYPNEDFGTITDSWSTIINNSNYATDYSIGDTKTVNFGSFGLVNMELVAIDADEKTAGGTARMTWIAKDLIGTHKMRDASSNADGWASTATGNMRDWLRNDVLAELPQVVRNAIVEVNKTYYDKTTSLTKTIADTIWIPSMRELFGGTSYESSGAIYNSKFTNDASRIKKLNGSAYNWWSRSAYSSSSNDFWRVDSSGAAYSNYASYTFGVAPGFCI